MFYNAIANDHGLAIDPLKALFVRPIGWISTVSHRGHANLAPYSFFNVVSENPGRVVFGSSGRKDTLRNIEERREFTVNLVSHELRDAMNITSAPVPTDVDEFALAGLEKAEGRLVAAPRVKHSPANLECQLEQIVPLGGLDGTAQAWLVVGRIVGVHINDRFMVDGRVDSAAMHMIVRLGYADYATIDAVWRLKRPNP